MSSSLTTPLVATLAAVALAAVLRWYLSASAPKAEDSLQLGAVEASLVEAQVRALKKAQPKEKEKKEPKRKQKKAVDVVVDAGAVELVTGGKEEKEAEPVELLEPAVIQDLVHVSADKKKSKKKKSNKKKVVDVAVIEPDAEVEEQDDVETSVHEKEIEQEAPEDVTAPLYSTIAAHLDTISLLQSQIDSQATVIKSYKSDVSTLEKTVDALQAKQSKLASEASTLAETNRALAKYAQDATAKQDLIACELDKVKLQLSSVSSTTSASVPTTATRETTPTTVTRATKATTVSKAATPTTATTATTKTTTTTATTATTALQDSSSAEIEKMRQILAAKDAELTRLSSLVTVLTSSNKEIRENWSCEVASLEKAHLEGVESVKETMSLHFQQVSEAHEEQLVNISKEVATCLGELERVRNEKVALLQKLEEASLEKQTILKESRAAKERELGEAIAKAQLAQSSAIEALESKHVREIQNLKQQHHRTIITAVQKTYSLTAAALQSTHASALEVLMGKHAKEIELVKESVAKKANAIALKEISDLKSRFGVERKAIVAEYENKIAELRVSAVATVAPKSVPVVENQEIDALKAQLAQKESILASAGQKVVELESTMAALKTAAASAAAAAATASAPKEIASVAPTANHPTISAAVTFIDIAPVTPSTIAFEFQKDIIALHETIASHRATIASLGVSLEDAQLSKAEHIAKTIHQRVSHPELVASIVKPVRSDSPVGSLIHKFEDVIHQQVVVGSPPKVLSPMTSFVSLSKAATPKCPPTAPRTIVSAPETTPSNFFSKAPVIVEEQKASPILASPSIPQVTPITTTIQPLQTKEPVTPQQPSVRSFELSSFEFDTGLKSAAAYSATQIEIAMVSAGKEGLFTVNMTPVNVPSVLQSDAKCAVQEAIVVSKKAANVITSAEVPVNAKSSPALKESTAFVEYEVETGLKAIAAALGTQIEGLNTPKPVAPGASDASASASTLARVAEAKSDGSMLKVVGTKEGRNDSAISVLPVVSVSAMQAAAITDAAVIAAEVRCGVKAIQVWNSQAVAASFVANIESNSDNVCEDERVVSWPVFVNGTGTTILIRGLDPVADEAEFTKAVKVEVSRLAEEAAKGGVASGPGASVVGKGAGVAANESKHVEASVDPQVLASVNPSAAFELTHSCVEYEIATGEKALAVARGILAEETHCSKTTINVPVAAPSTAITKTVPSSKQDFQETAVLASLVAQVDTLTVASAAEWEVQSTLSHCIVSISNQIEALYQ
ncbi:hypothetical protein BDR26DRAFT_1004939 [Obelidium mucronatum]|nr:hypothetical protein BDR26DRAFT_1004939 [Obelidium mucronatum]